MSLIELLFALFALGPGVLVLAIARRRWRAAPVERPKVPLGPALIGAGAMLFGAGVGLALGFGLVEPFLALAFRDLSMTSPTDALFARMRLGGALAIGLAVPGAAAVGALLLARDRSARFAAALAIVVALGLLGGAALGAVMLPPAIERFFAIADGMFIDVGGATALLADALLGFGLAGAIFTGSALAASRSAPAFRIALALGAIAPGVTLCVAGFLTPPDLLTQVALAIVLGGAYAAGLAVAGAMRAIRG